MTVDPLQRLLDLLGSGDDAAAEQVFRAYEPLLRKIVRRQLRPALRAKLDSSDVVQSVWVDLLHVFREGGQRFASVDHLRAFLVRAACNRLVDHVRHYRPERPLAEDEGGLPASAQPGPGEQAQADDLWERMLALSPPEHHELLRLKRQGLSSEEVAARVGLHEGSVRRILRNLARQLALETMRDDP